MLAGKYNKEVKNDFHKAENCQAVLPDGYSDDHSLPQPKDCVHPNEMETGAALMGQPPALMETPSPPLPPLPPTGKLALGAAGRPPPPGGGGGGGGGDLAATDSGRVQVLSPLMVL